MDSLCESAHHLSMTPSVWRKSVCVCQMQSGKDAGVSRYLHTEL